MDEEMVCGLSSVGSAICIRNLDIMTLSQLSCKILRCSLDMPVRINFRMVARIFVLRSFSEFIGPLHCLFKSNNSDGLCTYIFSPKICWSKKLLEQKLLN